jgi:hypothetical protein
LRLQAKGMKDENYITIQGWMINKLNLSGTELIIYAVIYGFSQDEGSVFDGSIKYLEKATGKKRTAIITNLKKLVGKGLLKKVSVSKLGMTFNQYSANVPPVRKAHPPHTESVPPSYGKRTPPRTENVPNILIDIPTDTTLDTKGKEPIFIKKGLILPWYSQEFVDKWLLWKSYKKKEKAFYFKSLESEQAALNKLHRISEGNEKKAISVIIQSIENGWSGFFKIKENNNGKQGKGKDLFSQESIKERLASW